MTTPHERAIRRAARKEAKDFGHSVPRGPSLLSRLESDLLDHTQRYLSMKAVVRGKGTSESHSMGIERGIIRGLAMAVARIRYAYEDQATATKRVEREFTHKAKEA
jgi:hypothetical protein